MFSYLDRTPDAITTETKTPMNNDPRVVYRFDLSDHERTILDLVLQDGNPGMIGMWFQSILKEHSAYVTITVSTPNEA